MKDKEIRMLDKAAHTLYCSECNMVFDYPAVCTTPTGKKIKICPICNNTKLVKWNGERYKRKEKSDKPMGIKQYIQSKLNRIPFYKGVHK